MVRRKKEVTNNSKNKEKVRVPCEENRNDDLFTFVVVGVQV